MVLADRGGLELRHQPPQTKPALFWLSKAQAILEPWMDKNPPPDLEHLYLSVLGRQLGLEHSFSKIRTYSKLRDKLLEQSPNHPRLLLEMGISSLFTPRFLGGGPDSARPYLLRALQWAKDYKDTEPLPAVGLAPDIYAWLARTEIRAGHQKQARLFAQRALDLKPRFSFVAEHLLDRIAKMED